MIQRITKSRSQSDTATVQSREVDIREGLGGGGGEEERRVETVICHNDRACGAGPVGMDLFSLRSGPPPTPSVQIPKLPVRGVLAAAVSSESLTAPDGGCLGSGVI